MEKVPRFLWWLLGGLVALAVSVLVAAIIPPHEHDKPAAKKASSSIPKPKPAPSPVAMHAKTIPAGLYAGPGDGCEAKMLVSNVSHVYLTGCSAGRKGIIQNVSGNKYKAVFPKIKYCAACTRSFTFKNGIVKLTDSQGCGDCAAASWDYGTDLPHSYMEIIPKHNYIISKLPSAENALLTFMPRHACNRDVSDIVDLLTGHGSLIGSGEYTGVLHTFPGPHRSTLVFWTVHVRAGSPLSYSALQLVEIESGTSSRYPKPQFSGTKTLRFRITHNHEFINIPELNPPTVTSFRQLERPSFSYSMKTEFRKCRARAQ